MGMIQEVAILIGDNITQPFRKFVAEKSTGMKFKIKRQVIRDSWIPSRFHKIVYKESVTWNLVSNDKTN